MPRRDWIAKGAAALTLLITLLWAFGYVGFQLGQQSGQREARSDTYARHAEEQIIEVCGELSGNRLTECISKQVEARNEHQRSERDIVAQERMSLWAALMFAATVLITIFTGLTLYSTFGALIAGRRTLKHSVVAARAALRAAQHAKKQAEDAAVFGAAQNAAYLSFVDGHCAVIRSKPAFEISILNNGNVTATQCALKHGWVHYEGHLQTGSYEFEFEGPWIGGIAPKQVINFLYLTIARKKQGYLTMLMFPKDTTIFEPSSALSGLIKLVRADP